MLDRLRWWIRHERMVDPPPPPDMTEAEMSPWKTELARRDAEITRRLDRLEAEVETITRTIGVSHDRA